MRMQEGRRAAQAWLSLPSSSRSAGAVADAVLFGRVQRGGGQAQVGQVEMRIVAKAVGALGLVDDLAMPMAFADERTRIVLGPHQRQHRHVPGAPVGQAGQLLDQQRVVGQVGFLAAMHLGVARRIHAGRALQRGHAQAGVVGQGRQPRQAAGVAGLGQRVLDEGDVRLFGLGTPSSPWGTSSTSGANKAENSRSLPALLDASTTRRSDSGILGKSWRHWEPAAAALPAPACHAAVAPAQEE